MKNLLAAFAVAVVPFFAPALAADGSDASGDEESLDGQIKSLTAMVATLTTSLATLAANVDDLANRGHGEIAIVETRPRSIQDVVPNGTRMSGHVDYYLVGTSTIPGFPRGRVAADGKFASYSASLPAGTYLFELQQPYSDRPVCHGSVSRLRDPARWVGRGCPWLSLLLEDEETDRGRTRFEDGSGIYRITSNAGWFSLRHRFPSEVAFTEERPIASYKGAVKITRLK